jgi:hypothetical protein
MAQRGFVWVILYAVDAFRWVGIGCFIILGSSVKGNDDEAGAIVV